MESRFTITVVYDWDKVTQDELVGVVRVLPGVHRVALGSVTEPESIPIRWRVQDNVTGEPKSIAYDQKETAEYTCRSLNTPEMGGLYGVYTNESGTWRRDLE